MFHKVKLEKYKGILIDLDDTLYVYEPNHQRALAAFLKVFSAQYNVRDEQSMETYLLARITVHQQLHGQAASHSRLLYAKTMIEMQTGKTNAAFALQMEKIYWDTFLTEIALHPLAIEFLDSCLMQKIPVAIVTDLTTAIQLRKFEHLGLGKWINLMITSEEAGAEKPAAAPFLMALNKMGLTPQEVIMIGDSAKKDQAGAVALGIDWIHPFE